MPVLLSNITPGTDDSDVAPIRNWTPYAIVVVFAPGSSKTLFARRAVLIIGSSLRIHSAEGNARLKQSFRIYAMCSSLSTMVAPEWALPRMIDMTTLVFQTQGGKYGGST